MTQLACGHTHSGPARRCCRHVLETADADYLQRFTGQGKDFELVCADCRQAQPDELRSICPDCFARLQEDGSWDGIVGQPEILERESGLHFRHETVTLDVPWRDRLLDIQPVNGFDQNRWIALTQNGQLIRLDLEKRTTEPLGQLPVSNLDLNSGVLLHVAPDGSTIAVVNARGQFGVVFNVETGHATMRLDRGNYRNEHCNFPAAFVEVDGRLLLIHGTAWNRLDISDPKTGTLLTERASPSYRRDEPRPAHYLDYFHCGLAASPNGEHVADNGWVWQPVGMVATWSIRRWLRTNVWESEDGPTRKTLSWRHYYWDGPLCWIDENRLVVWGYGEDDLWLIPAVRIFDVVSGHEERWFAGPKGNLNFDRFLFSTDNDAGTSVWDVATGERLLHDAAFCPFRYHRGIKAFLTMLPDGGFQLSRLAGRTLEPSWLSSNDGTVIKLARGIREERAFDRLPILGDALEDAGCIDTEILGHCRQGAEHVHSCWVIDAILDG